MTRGEWFSLLHPDADDTLDSTTALWNSTTQAHNLLHKNTYYKHGDTTELTAALQAKTGQPVTYFLHPVATRKNF